MNIAIPIVNNKYKKNFRITNLPSPSDLKSSNISYSYQFSDSQICTFNFYNYTMLDLLGYSISSYDIIDNENVFNNQAEFFFGDKINTHSIEYKVMNIPDINVPYLIYEDHNKNVIIFAFRGFNSLPEIALYLQISSFHILSPFYFKYLHYLIL